MKRAVRLAQIQRLLYKNPDGLTSRELAEHCRVHVRTICRDLLDLQSELGVPVTQDGTRYFILSGYALSPVSFSFDEAIALFLACRLAMRHSGKSGLQVGRVLEKMAAVLPATLTQYLKPDRDTVTTNESGPDLSGIFESMVIAWIKRRQVRIRNISLQDNQEKEWLFEPYFMEMSGVGHSIHVIGRAVRNGVERFPSIKLDNIISAEIQETTFEPPSKSQVEGLLSRIWNAMWEEEMEVGLWFSPGRSLCDETSSHSSSLRPNAPDDGYMMTLHVSGWLQAHPSAMDRGSQMELLSPASVEKHFSNYAWKLWQTSSVLLQERARRTGAPNLDK